MTILLTCDAPDCTEAVAAIPLMSQVRGPGNWWVMVSADSITVACCTAHLLRIGRLVEKGAG